MQKRRNERCQISDAIAVRAEYEDGNRSPNEILLKAQALIERDERVVLGRRCIQQCAVREIGPATLVDRLDLVANEMHREIARQISVEQHAHVS